MLLLKASVFALLALAANGNHYEDPFNGHHYYTPDPYDQYNPFIDSIDETYGKLMADEKLMAPSRVKHRDPPCSPDMTFNYQKHKCVPKTLRLPELVGAEKLLSRGPRRYFTSKCPYGMVHNKKGKCVLSVNPEPENPSSPTGSAGIQGSHLHRLCPLHMIRIRGRCVKRGPKGSHIGRPKNWNGGKRLVNEARKRRSGPVEIDDGMF